MILSKTMLALQARDAFVFVVTVPACTIKKGTFSNMARDGFDNPAQDLPLPEFRDVYADANAAAKKVIQHDTLAQRYGLPLSEVVRVRAVDLNAFTLLPR